MAKTIHFSDIFYISYKCINFMALNKALIKLNSIESKKYCISKHEIIFDFLKIAPLCLVF